MWHTIARLLLSTLTAAFVVGCGGPSGSTDSTTTTDPTPTEGNITVAFAMTPASGYAPLTINLDASDTVSHTGRPVSSYAWSAVDESGNEVQTASGIITTMAFISPGTYTITLTASDDKARFGTGSQTIEVTERSSATPSPVQAVIAVSDGAEPLSVVLDASGSVASDGASVISYSWTITDSSGAIVEAAAGVTATVVFASEGTYTVTLEVADSAGNSDTAQRSVTVAYTGMLQASFSLTPSHGTVPFDIELDGSASQNNSIQINSYAWSLTDSGGTEVQAATGRLTTMAILTAGAYVVTLTVTDEYGRTAVAHRTLLAEDPVVVASTGN